MLKKSKFESIYKKIISEGFYDYTEQPTNADREAYWEANRKYG